MNTTAQFIGEQEEDQAEKLSEAYCEAQQLNRVEWVQEQPVEQNVPVERNLFKANIDQKAVSPSVVEY